MPHSAASAAGAQPPSSSALRPAAQPGPAGRRALLSAASRGSARASAASARPPSSTRRRCRPRARSAPATTHSCSSAVLARCVPPHALTSTPSISTSRSGPATWRPPHPGSASRLAPYGGAQPLTANLRFWTQAARRAQASAAPRRERPWLGHIGRPALRSVTSGRRAAKLRGARHGASGCG